MSAVSKFMAALEQATHPERPPEPQKPSSVLENNACLGQKKQVALEPSAGPPDPAYSHSLGSIRGLQDHSTMKDADFDQKATRDAQSDQWRESEILPVQTKVVPAPFAGEPPTEPQMPAKDSLDDLFSDAESDQDNMLHDDPSCEDDHDSGHIQNGCASDGAPVWVQPYGPNAPMQCDEEMNTQDFGSPQISPETPFNPLQPLSRTDPQSHAHDVEVHSAVSEEDQIAHFSDKAFRKALREVEPSLSKQQQYYAWRNAYQNAYDDRQSSDADEVEFEEKVAAINDQNPPYQLGIEPVGYMDGFPIFADINAVQAMEEIGDKVEHINSGEGNPAYDDVGHGERYHNRQGNDSSHLSADPEGVPSFDPFSPHHNLPTATAPRADLVARERMQQSSFSEAVQALEKDNAERIARESEVDEAHLQRLRTLSRRRQWAVENSAAREDKRRQTESPRPVVVGSENSPDSQVTSPTRSEAHEVTTSPSKMNHDESFATALESPDKQRSGSETMSTIQAEMAEYARQQYAHVHESDEEVEPPTPRSQIPGLEHLNRPSPPPRHETAAQPQLSTPPSPTSLSPSNANIRKSIEPETPTHLLHRDCTPAFEDRSTTPSPRSLLHGDGDRNTDVEMDEAPTPPNHDLPSHAHDGTKPILPLPTSSPDPISSPGPLKQHPPQISVTSNTNRARSRSRSPTKRLATQASSSHPSPSPPKPTKQRHPERTTTTAGRRKSAVQGSGAKIEKPNKPVPKNRTATRKVNTPSIRTVTAAAAAAPTTTTNTTASGKKNKKNGGIDVSAEVVNLNVNVVGSTSKVKAAVERIEAGMLQKDNRTRERGTPPARRSRRLMERRGETPEPEPEP